MTITEFCEKFGIARNAVFRRLEAGLPNNNIVGQRRIGKRLILLSIDKTIKFERRKENAA